MLERLARDAGAVVTREQLIDDVWDENWWGSTKTLDVHINALRRKLGEQPGGPSRIATIRGVGYRLDGRRRTPAVRRRILVTIVVVAAVAVARVLRAGRARRAQPHPAQRPARAAARGVDRRQPHRRRRARSTSTRSSRPSSADHDLAVYDPAGSLVDGNGPPRADPIVRVGHGGRFAEGYVDGDLVAAVPVRTAPDGPELVVRISEPGSESDAPGRASVLLLGLGGVGRHRRRRRASAPCWPGG